MKSQRTTNQQAIFKSQMSELPGRQIRAIFEVDGYIFKGNLAEAKMTYIKRNPSKKFIPWLIDNFSVIN